MTVDVKAAAFCGEITRRMSIGDASAAMARSAGIVRAEALGTPDRTGPPLATELEGH